MTFSYEAYKQGDVYMKLNELVTNTRTATIEAAASKLSKNSPPEAHFHRASREWHKEAAKNARHDVRTALNDGEEHKSKKLYAMHKKAAEHHHAMYQKAMGTSI